MLNNISNFFNLVKGGRVKKTLAPNDMIAIGVRNPVTQSNFQPAAIFFKDLQEQLIAGGSNCPIETDFKVGSVGPKVSFSKANYADPTTHKDVIIPGALEITRDDNGGIYNIAAESNYNNSISPKNTAWNTQFLDAANTSWAPLWDISNRTFDTWRNAITDPTGNPVPPMYVGMPVIMTEQSSGGFWLILFTEWTSNGNGGGFAYDRYEIYPEVFFDKPDYATSTVDKISDGVWLARNDNGGLYNAVSETFPQNGESPFNTRWNSIYTDSRPDYSGYTDLGNLESRVYTSFVDALDNNVGNNLPGTELIMHDLTTDLYWIINFSSWTQGGSGGGFEYTRKVVPQSCGIKFADGTILNTATTSIGGVAGVQSVTGLDTDNTDPLNPIVNIAVDGVTVTGDGTSGNPLVSVASGVASVTGLDTDNTDPLNPIVQISVDGTTITGDGTPGNPLIGSGGSLPAWLEYNATDLTIWNNGKGNVATNTSYGDGALRSNTTGGQNTAIGALALENNTTSSLNTAIGSGALRSNTTGNGNTAIGINVGYLNTTGIDNIAIGVSALFSNTSGNYNVALGTNALGSNVIGAHNIAIGLQALENNITYENIAIGQEAARFTTTGTNNVALGLNSLTLNTTGSRNIAIGFGASLRNTIGNDNVSLGWYALANNVTGLKNTVIGTGADCVNFNGSIVLGYAATATASNQFVVGTAAVNAGAVTVEVNASSQVWNVVINGVARKILLA